MQTPVAEVKLPPFVPCNGDWAAVHETANCTASRFYW